MNARQQVLCCQLSVVLKSDKGLIFVRLLFITFYMEKNMLNVNNLINIKYIPNLNNISLKLLFEFYVTLWMAQSLRMGSAKVK